MQITLGWKDNNKMDIKETCEHSAYNAGNFSNSYATKKFLEKASI